MASLTSLTRICAPLRPRRNLRYVHFFTSAVSSSLSRPSVLTRRGVCVLRQYLICLSRRIIIIIIIHSSFLDSSSQVCARSCYLRPQHWDSCLQFFLQPRSSCSLDILTCDFMCADFGPGMLLLVLLHLLQYCCF
jgi:hypothetical protein